MSSMAICYIWWKSIVLLIFSELLNVSSFVQKAWYSNSEHTLPTIIIYRLNNLQYRRRGWGTRKDDTRLVTDKVR